MSSSGSLFNIARAIAWRDDASDVTMPIFWDFMSFIGERADTLLAVQEAEHPEIVLEFRRVASEMPNNSVLRLLGAPITIRKLLEPEGDGGASPIMHMLSAARVESAIAQAGSYRLIGPDVQEVSAAWWSPMGDTCLLPDGTVGRFPSVPLLPSLDFGSPYAQPHQPAAPSAQPGRIEILASEDVANAVERLHEAAVFMGETQPAVLQFLRTYTRVIAFRRDASQPGLASSSASDAPGQTVLTNYHNSSVGLEDVADGLIHEAIHDLLSMAMTVEPWTSDLAVLEQEYQSPWTGHSLSAAAILHACFVWYGLWSFWRMASSSGAVTGRNIEARIDAAALGFLEGNVVHDLESVLSSLRPDLKSVLANMQHEVRRSRGRGDG